MLLRLIPIALWRLPIQFVLKRTNTALYQRGLETNRVSIFVNISHETLRFHRQAASRAWVPYKTTSSRLLSTGSTICDRRSSGAWTIRCSRQRRSWLGVVTILRQLVSTASIGAAPVPSVRLSKTRSRLPGGRTSIHTAFGRLSLG